MSLKETLEMFFLDLVGVSRPLESEAPGLAHLDELEREVEELEQRADTVNRLADLRAGRSVDD